MQAEPPPRQKHLKKLFPLTTARTPSTPSTPSTVMSDSPVEDSHNGLDRTFESALGSRTVTTNSQIQTQSHTSSTSTSRIETSSVTSSSSSATNASLKHLESNLCDFKNSMKDMKNNLRKSIENLDDDDDDDEEERNVSSCGANDAASSVASPTVTFPDSPPPMAGPPVLLVGGAVATAAAQLGDNNTLKFEEKKVTSASRTKVVTDKFSAEKNTANLAEERRLQSGDLNLEQKRVAAARHDKVEADGVTASQSRLMQKGQRSIKMGEISQQETQKFSEGNITVKTKSYELKEHASKMHSQMVTATSTFNQEKRTTSSQSNITFKGGTSSMIGSVREMSQLKNGSDALTEDDLLRLDFEDLSQLSKSSNPQEVKSVIKKYARYVEAFIKNLQTADPASSTRCLDQMNEMIRRAWAVPTYGHELGHSLCDELRLRGGLDLLMVYCTSSHQDLQLSSARVLEQCLTTENRAHVVENGLDKVVEVACICTKMQHEHRNTNTYSRVGTGILEHLFKHSEETCSDVIRLGGLDAVLFECRKNDVETLRHCAGALANLSLYGGAENQVAMIQRKVPMWLFPLAFHNDDNIKYYACLAITVLVANSEIEAAVLNSETLELVEPFVTSHNPSEFAKSNLAHAHGQSNNWLRRLVPVLSSNREEARNLAAFHFCMEAGIKKQQGNTEIFREIGAIEPLKKVASCPNAVASKYAAQALRLMGEEVPHKLSQQVPLWSTEDVCEWVKQIGFAEYVHNFLISRVDGDLLLQLGGDDLKDDIGLTNGISRRRFMRELQNLKRMADYSSRDRAGVTNFLQAIGLEYQAYTYGILNAGIDSYSSLVNLTDEQMFQECGIVSSIHRCRIMEAMKLARQNCSSPTEVANEKPLDVFVSYRRSNGSQLASLLKVHLQLRGFTVFIDVERLEAGKFDNNLLQSIRQAKHFLLVLTADALDRCFNDKDCKDWVHREIVEALQSQCNIIPIFDGFEWPKVEELPEDMRQVCHFNGVRWIHDYQDACVDKLERFMRGDYSRLDSQTRGLSKGDMTPGTPSSAVLSRGPPVYQRMHSNDSKGSDKDINGNN